MVKFTEAAVAVGFGAADALVASKISRTLPGGISAVTALEIGGVAVGLWGDKLGLSAEIHDPIFFSSAALLGARLTRAASAGKLLAGPSAWGGVGGDPTYALSAGAAGGDMLPSGGVPSRSVRLLAGRRAGSAAVGGASVYPAISESPGVAG